ncbi:MAG: methyltransferase domain-containing protein [Candidatus Bathyarchaeota archaeon]|nr:methyltransferase domain-containing protein [Candidatus Bathyarchaeota archaeon]
MKILCGGAPTGFSGNEWGVMRRFEVLMNFYSLNDKVILDLGCGVGAYSKFAKACNADLVVGFDMNRKYLLKAKSCERINAAGQALTFKDSSFDVVLMVEVLDHLPFEEKAVKEAKRVLKRNGALLITVPNKFFPFETHGMRIMSTEIRNILGIGIPFLSWMPLLLRNKIERARIYTQKRLLNLLREQGLEPVIVDYMMPPLDGMRNQRIASSLRKLLRKAEASAFRYFGCHIIVVAVNI